MSFNEFPQGSVDQEAGEQLPIASFQEYEAFCNVGNSSSRKAGILVEEIYDAAVSDPRTTFATVAGKTMPLIVDIEHGLGLGYEVDRAKEYAAGQSNISVLALPVTGLTEADCQAVLDGVASYSGGLYFSDHNGEDRQALFSALAAHGKYPQEKPLLDSRADADNSQAALSLYACDAKNMNISEVDRQPVTLAAVQQVFDEQERPNITDPDNAVFIENGANLTQEQLSQIWELYQNRFQFLGENHPISMEDDEESFLSVLQQPDTTVSLRYVDGKIVCLADFTEKFDNLYWLNRDFLEAQAAVRAEGASTLFFPGIVANQENQGSSYYVIGKFTEMAARAGMSARILFENTNLSKRYIPDIVEKVIRAARVFDVTKPQEVDKVTYRLALIS